MTEDFLAQYDKQVKHDCGIEKSVAKRKGTLFNEKTCRDRVHSRVAHKQGVSDYKLADLILIQRRAVAPAQEIDWLSKLPQPDMTKDLLLWGRIVYDKSSTDLLFMHNVYDAALSEAKDMKFVGRIGVTDNESDKYVFVDCYSKNLLPYASVAFPIAVWNRNVDTELDRWCALANPPELPSAPDHGHELR